MAEKTLLEQANEKLRKVQDQLDAMHYRLPRDLQMENLDQQVEKIRKELFYLRSQLSTLTQIKQLIKSQEAIHDALVFLAKIRPLNERTKGGELMCPVS